MSPHPSVHEEALREIEASKPRRSFWRRPVGCAFCLGVFAGAAIAAGGYYLWRSRPQVPDVRTSLDQLGKMGPAWRRWRREIRQMPPGEMLERLRGRVAQIQEEWENLSESGEIERRIETLREELAAKRDAAGEAGRQSWDDLVAKSEEVLRRVRERAALAPKELDELLAGIKELQEKCAAGEPGGPEGEEGEVGSPSATSDDSRSADRGSRGADPASSEPDYRMGR
ncbi:MAG TPA: hypothetical protein VM492_04110 [Sumerlaeia bacterium]|nr:hypothetical protein [Sumerlaeia bacterium]